MDREGVANIVSIHYLLVFEVVLKYVFSFYSPSLGSKHETERYTSKKARQFRQIVLR